MFFFGSFNFGNQLEHHKKTLDAVERVQIFLCKAVLVVYLSLLLGASVCQSSATGGTYAKLLVAAINVIEAKASGVLA